jgi:hypothetical protein
VVDATPGRGIALVAASDQASVGTRAPFDARSLPVFAGAGLPARLWRQPVVRAAARASASALALSVGLRLARLWWARSRARRGLRSVAPSLAGALAEQLPATRLPRPVARGGAVVETWIYVRQERVGR